MIPVLMPFPQFPLFSTNKYANGNPAPSISAKTEYNSNFKLFVLSKFKKGNISTKIYAIDATTLNFTV